MFATTSMGVFIGTIVKNMPQLGMVFILTILPLMMLSGTMSPYEKHAFGIVVSNELNAN